MEIRLFPQARTIRINGNAVRLTVGQYRVCEYILLRSTRFKYTHRDDIEEHIYGRAGYPTRWCVQVPLAEANKKMRKTGLCIRSKIRFGFYVTEDNHRVFLHG